MQSYGLSGIIPDELISEILERLPAKNLKLLKCVSKGWYAFIRSRSFVKNHLRKMKFGSCFSLMHKKCIAYPPICYLFDPSNIGSIERVHCDYYEEFEVLGTCNGLVLFCDIHDTYSLSNPITRETLIIPNVHIKFPTNFTNASLFFGLGYDNDNDDYIIIRFCRFWIRGDFQTDVKLFSRNLNIWYTVNCFPFKHPPSCNAHFVGGCFHWKIYKGQGVYAIATFDLKKKIYGWIDLPVFYCETWSLMVDALDDNNLAVYGCRIGNEILGVRTYYFEMHILSYSISGSKWHKFTISQKGVMSPNYKLVPIQFIKNSKTKLMFRSDPSGTFSTYDFTTKEIFDLEEVDRVYGIQHTYKYVESLVSPVQSLDN